MRLLLVICLVLSGNVLFANTQIYLYSSVIKGEEKLKIKDIAMVDGSDEERSLCEDTEITDSILADTYIDCGELSLLLRKKLRNSFIIYGSSVKVYEADSPQKKVLSIRNGEQVKVLVKKKNITIELTGVAVKDAADGARVVVKCGKKEISGIVNNKTVMCEL